MCYVDCALFGRGAEVFNQYMSKGRPVLVEGRLQFQQWTTPEGDKRSKHEVVVENFTFLGAGRGADSGHRPAAAATSGVPGPSPAVNPGYDAPVPPTDDDIPF